MIAIYSRQSVDKKDSISIESQIEFCKRFNEITSTTIEEYRIYSDKGFSGKNIDRPAFQEMLKDIRRGLITKVLVYKIDRISRNIKDFVNINEMFKKYNISFMSTQEQFDTSTPMGSAMLNITMTFAQLERETTQQRVKDNYVTRSMKGFYMGGRVPFGFRLQDTIIDGVKTKYYIQDEYEAGIIKLIFDLYSQKHTSFGEVVRYLNEHNYIKKQGLLWDKARVSEIVRNAIYVKADIDVYNFLKKQGSIIHSDIKSFDGEHGCYIYKAEKTARKYVSLKGQNIIVAPHIGIVNSDIWIKAREKACNNKQVAPPARPKNSWLVGKIKCNKCGYALTCRKLKGRKYYRCSHAETTRTHDCKSVRAEDVDSAVLQEMITRLKKFKTLMDMNNYDNVNDAKTNELKLEIATIEKQIDDLVQKLMLSNGATLKYLNDKINELDKQKTNIEKQIQKLSGEYLPKSKILKISDYMSKWEELSFDDKRTIVDILIERVKVDETEIFIEWKV